MSSFIYTSSVYNIFRSKINFDTDVFKVLLTSPKYIPDKSQTKRSEIQGEVDGNGYILGGQEVNILVTRDVQRNRVDISLGKSVWSDVTITANGAIYYRSSNVDGDLICFIEFTNEANPKNGTLIVTPSIIRWQN